MSNDQDNRPEASESDKQLRVVPPLPAMTHHSLTARVLERVVPRKNRFLGFIWILAVIGVVVLFSNIQGEATQFYGIAESQLRSISFQHPVEIVEVTVVEGQRVDKNAHLLEVRRYDLDVNLLVLEEQINEIRAEHTATRHIVSAEITSLGAERSAQIETLNTKIDSLETQHQLNQALLNSISSDSPSTPSMFSPMQAEIRGLKAEKRKIEQVFQTRINLQKQRLANIAGPGDARIAELVKQKNELLRQSQALVVTAPFSGSVGSVMFKQGEQVDAFNPVISVHGNFTRNIKGYIHEAVSNKVEIGQTVWIRALSANGEDKLIQGKVESLGSRIVEYPERLKRSSLIAAWGREANIRLPSDNKIMQGEKVAVLLNRPQQITTSLLAMLWEYLPIATVQAWNNSEQNPPVEIPRDIESEIANLQTDQIEASGISWNPATGSFFLVSDEQPVLYEMSTNGKIIKQFPLDSFGKITDLEDISRDGDNLYLAASLSHNKKDKLKAKRRRLMRLSMAGQDIQTGSWIDLYQVLQESLASKQFSTELRDFLGEGIDARSLDLEAQAVIDNNLYLGFKAPFDASGNTVILKLSDVDALFKHKAVEVSIWLKLDLGDTSTGTSNRLSGFAFSDSGIYLLTVAKSTQQLSSILWQYDFSSQKLLKISEYPGLRAEGISLAGDTSNAVIVFDGGGGSPSRFVHRVL